jgi:hypothetical protein
MRCRSLWGITAVLVTLAAGSGDVASAANRDNLLPLKLPRNVTTLTAEMPGHRAALDTRQQLRDQVCVAMADGRISPFERSRILGNAKQVLSEEEYWTFEASLDRISPPTPTSATGRSFHFLAKRSKTEQNPSATAMSHARPPAEPSRVLPVSAEFIVTDQVAPDRPSR